MRAILFDAPGGPDVLRIGKAPRPKPGPGELLVRVRATALNRADLMQREGKYPPPPGASDILGLEMAGEVEAVGEEVQDFAPGDRVCALLGGGGYAEYVAIPQALALAIPENMSYAEAAAIPEVFLTAFQALALLAGTQPGEHVLIHAGASGVGTAAIQLTKHLGATAHVTASAPKHGACRSLGAETTIDYRTEDFAERVLEVTGGAGADVILDFLGASYVPGNLRALARDGRWVILALMGGSRVDAFDLRTLFSKRGALITTTLRSRSLDYKINLTDHFRREIWPAFAKGALRPVIDTVMPWEDVKEAHRRMGANENVGKIVLTVT